jgi:mono/diheme cytochrome c family protein
MQRAIVITGCLAVALLACGERETKPPAAAAPAPAAAPTTAAPPAAMPAAAEAEAQQIFATRCTTCHGSAGAGDGPGSAGLEPKPRNFQDAAWQDSVSDEHITNIVLYGGAAVGKSPSMPGNPDLMSKPEVVRALVAHVRGLARR